MTGTNLYTLMPSQSANHYFKDCDEYGYVLYGKFDTAATPDTTANVFQKGCNMIKTDAANTVSGLYQNTGTLAAPTWSLVGSIASGSITGADLVTGKIYSTVAARTNGTTPVNVFGATVPFGATVTGAYLVADDATAGNVTIASTAGTLATIAKGTTAGALVGATSIANPTIASGNTFTVVSSSAGNGTVFITFTVN